MVVPVIYMVLILVGASIPAELETEENVLRFLLLPPVWQNLLHIPAYGLLAFLWRWSLGGYLRAGPAIAAAFVLTVGFGVFQEWVQSMVPGRYGSVTDVLFDTVGAGLGLLCFERVRRFGSKMRGDGPGTGPRAGASPG